MYVLTPSGDLPFIFHGNFQSENRGIIDNSFICLQKFKNKDSLQTKAKKND